MHSPSRAYRAVFGRLTTLIRRQPTRLAWAFALAALAQGCTAQTVPPLAGPDPANPAARAKATAYRSDIAPYESRRSVEPRPWQEQNQQVAPTPKP
jgi:hypothetical protein